eukprot:jgi/Mesvir1/20116/Mv13355-RA.1
MGNVQPTLAKFEALSEDDQDKLMQCLLEGCVDISESCVDRYLDCHGKWKHVEPELAEMKRRYLTLRQLLSSTPSHEALMKARERARDRVKPEHVSILEKIYKTQDAAYDAWVEEETQKRLAREAEEEYLRFKRERKAQWEERKRVEAKRRAEAEAEETRAREMRRLNTHDIRKWFKGEGEGRPERNHVCAGTGQGEKSQRPDHDIRKLFAAKERELKRPTN